jgi:hypothetical protein
MKISTLGEMPNKIKRIWRARWQTQTLAAYFQTNENRFRSLICILLFWGLNTE